MTIFKIYIAEKVPYYPHGYLQENHRDTLLRGPLPSQKSLSLKVSSAKAVAAIHQARVGSEVMLEESVLLKLPTTKERKL